jgi:hypothetical protein
MRQLLGAAALALSLGFTAQTAIAASAVNAGVIVRVQVDSYALPGRKDLVWLRVAGTWAGATCGADWAYFNAKDNPHFLDLVLAARTANKPIEVYVNDTLPKIDDFCQITNISL